MSAREGTGAEREGLVATIRSGCADRDESEEEFGRDGGGEETYPRMRTEGRSRRACRSRDAGPVRWKSGGCETRAGPRPGPRETGPRATTSPGAQPTVRSDGVSDLRILSFFSGCATDLLEPALLVRISPYIADWSDTSSKIQHPIDARPHSSGRGAVVARTLRTSDEGTVDSVSVFVDGAERLRNARYRPAGAGGRTIDSLLGARRFWRKRHAASEFSATFAG